AGQTWRSGRGGETAGGLSRTQSQRAHHRAQATVVRSRASYRHDGNQMKTANFDQGSPHTSKSQPTMTNQRFEPEGREDREGMVRFFPCFPTFLFNQAKIGVTLVATLLFAAGCSIP